MIRPFLSIIIPAYNEERRLADTLDDNLRYLSGKNWPWEMIIVSDGSRDGTVELAQSFVKRAPLIKVLANVENHGKGFVVKQGMLAAGGYLRLFMDADNSTRLVELEKFWPFIKGPSPISLCDDFVSRSYMRRSVLRKEDPPSAEKTRSEEYIKVSSELFFESRIECDAKGRKMEIGDGPIKRPVELVGQAMQDGGDNFDVVIGSLGVAGAEIKKGEKWWRVLVGQLGNLFIQALVLPGIKDTQRGFKLFTATAAEKIFSNLKIDRWGFDVEALALARRFGFPIKELPVAWTHDVRSKIKPIDYLRVLWEVLKIRWRLWWEI